jgi:peptidoglycan/LPS O-acetylase OafA/YrhL
LRIFPALWVCFAVTLLLLAVTGFLGTVLGTTRFGVWSVAQLTFGQFVKLPAFGGFGVGVPNGSLWTIPVELGFYVAIPILYLLIIDRTTKRTGNLLVGALLTVSLLSAIALAQVDPNQTQLSAKLFYQTPIPHLYLFLLGVLAQRNYGSVSRWVEGKFLWWTGICLVLGIWAVSEPASLPQQGLFVLARLSLAAWVLAFAFSRPTVSDKLLRRNDPSYGTYLYHMLIVNMLVEAGIVGNAWLLPAVMIGAAAVGLLSWKAVEQPMLRLKATRRPAPATPALASPESSAA